MSEIFDIEKCSGLRRLDRLFMMDPNPSSELVDDDDRESLGESERTDVSVLMYLRVGIKMGFPRWLGWRAPWIEPVLAGGRRIPYVTAPGLGFLGLDRGAR